MIPASIPPIRQAFCFLCLLQRGAPSYVHPDSVATIGNSPIPIQAAAGVGISYQPHARVDFGASVTHGVSGLAPWSVLIQFVTISVGKQYQGSAATPLTELAADLTAVAAQKLKEGIEELLKDTYAESPIDPKLDSSCLVMVVSAAGPPFPATLFCRAASDPKKRSPVGPTASFYLFASSPV